MSSVRSCERKEIMSVNIIAYTMGLVYGTPKREDCFLKVFSILKEINSFFLKLDYTNSNKISKNLKDLVTFVCSINH